MDRDCYIHVLHSGYIEPKPRVCASTQCRHFVKFSENRGDSCALDGPCERKDFPSTGRRRRKDDAEKK